MDELREKILRVIGEATSDDHYEIYAAVWALLDHPVHPDDIDHPAMRAAYFQALFKVADVFQRWTLNRRPSVQRPARLLPVSVHHDAVDPLTRVYTLDAGDAADGIGYSYREVAAFKLGLLYQTARCPHSAVWWFRRSLALARGSGRPENILGNLHGLAWNLEGLGLDDEAGALYAEMRELLERESASGVPPMDWLVHASMHDLRHGDAALGEAVMLKMLGFHIGRPLASFAASGPLPAYFFTALVALVAHRIAAARIDEAIALARTVSDNAERFADPEPIRAAMHGLVAKAHVRAGRLDDALGELSQVHDIDRTEFIRYDGGALVENLELWIDIARIHAANRQHAQAITAYEILAYNLGSLIVGKDSDTMRLRFYWLQQMASVVHEMASFFLVIDDPGDRCAAEPRVANALLQLKANLFLALEGNQTIRFSAGHELFTANRDFAAAARKVAAAPGDPAEMLAVEDALFVREDIERDAIDRHGLRDAFDPALWAAAGMPMGAVERTIALILSTRYDPAQHLKFDFRTSPQLENATVVLDYSVVDFKPPRAGLNGPSGGLRYLGIRLSLGDLRLIDLGDVDRVDAGCLPLIRAMSAPPARMDDDASERNLGPARSGTSAGHTDLDALSKAAYNRLVAPFEPLGASLLLSTDGALAGLPFHALLNDKRYLIEDCDVVYCHSILQKDSLSARRVAGSLGYIPPNSKTAVLLGDPDYSATGLPALAGTKLEIRRVAALLARQDEDDDAPAATENDPAHDAILDAVNVHTGRDATVARLLDVERPIILHIAAHGSFAGDGGRPPPNQATVDGGHFRRWADMGSSPFTPLDEALLGSVLMLAADADVANGPGPHGLLTALELGSLNLLDCHMVALSACETGLAASERGAGALGFQYAVRASFAKAGLLTLWKVLDRETSLFMVDFYRGFLGQGSAKAGYLTAMRKHCRSHGHRVHPYRWAAFLFLDQEYGVDSLTGR